MLFYKTLEIKMALYSFNNKKN